MFSLDFCIPRYLIMKELLMNKLRVRRFEHKIKSRRIRNLTNSSWEEKKKNGWRRCIRTGKDITIGMEYRSKGSDI